VRRILLVAMVLAASLAAPASASATPVLSVDYQNGSCPQWGFTLTGGPPSTPVQLTIDWGGLTTVKLGSGTNQDGYTDLFVGGIPEYIGRLGTVRYITVTLTWEGGPVLSDTLRYCVPDPKTLADCSKARFASFGFQRQWQCILFVVRARICERLREHGHEPQFCVARL
jgi:hypothetical protein